MTVPRRDRNHRAAGRSMNRRAALVLLIVMLLVVLAGAAASTPQISVVGHDERTLSYRAGGWAGKVYVAAFGDPMEKGRTFRLLLPPPGQDLCHMPPDFIDNGVVINSSSIPSTSDTGNYSSANGTTTVPSFVDYTDTIGLLIPRGQGECSEEVQTLVALQLQDTIPTLRYLIIHGTDGTVGSTPVTLNLYHYGGGGDVTDDGRSSISYDRLYRTMGVMYMPFNEFIQLEDIMLEQAAEQNWTVPYLFDPASAAWQFTVGTNGKIRIVTDVETSVEAELFYWLRMVLFVVLIVTPCFRAGYLWYAGGGRLHWRRNDRGRIVGILYVPPMPIWLWLRRQNQRGDDERGRISPKLSEEQFNQLPIISYQRNKKYVEDPSESARPEGHDAERVDVTVDVEQGGDISLRLHSADTGNAVAAADDDKLIRPTKMDCDPNVDLQMQRTEDTEDMNIVPSTDSGLGHNYDPPSSPMMTSTDIAAVPLGNNSTVNNSNGEQDYEQNELVTTCTMCSICIDDFETGEELVLLPRCKHAFHKECIYPWLLERQGCCPLCKVRVFDDGYSDETVVDGGTSTEEGVDHPIVENHRAVVSPVADTEPTTDSVPHDDEDDINNRTATPVHDEQPVVHDVEAGRTCVLSDGVNSGKFNPVRSNDE